MGGPGIRGRVHSPLGSRVDVIVGGSLQRLILVGRASLLGSVLVRGRAALPPVPPHPPGPNQSQTLQPPEQLRSCHDALVSTSGLQASCSSTVGNDRRKRTDPQPQDLICRLLGGQLGEFDGSLEPQLCQRDRPQALDIAHGPRCFEGGNDDDRGSAGGLSLRDRIEPCRPLLLIKACRLGRRGVVRLVRYLGGRWTRPAHTSGLARDRRGRPGKTMRTAIGTSRLSSSVRNTSALLGHSQGIPFQVCRRDQPPATYVITGRTKDLETVLRK